MAEVVANGASGEFNSDLYSRRHISLSTFFAHTNGFALLRHVRPDGALRDRPSYPWAKRSAVRTADACVGVLALAVANRSGRPADEFVNYANAHIMRSLAPVVTMAGRGARRSIRWRLIPQAIHELQAGIAYHASEDRKQDPWDVRREWTRQNLVRILQILDPEGQEATFELMLDEFVVLMIGPRPVEAASEADDS
jgi:hypothetical protein